MYLIFCFALQFHFVTGKIFIISAKQKLNFDKWLGIHKFHKIFLWFLTSSWNSTIKSVQSAKLETELNVWSKRSKQTLFELWEKILLWQTKFQQNIPGKRIEGCPSCFDPVIWEDLISKKLKYLRRAKLGISSPLKFIHVIFFRVHPKAFNLFCEIKCGLCQFCHHT